MFKFFSKLRKNREGTTAIEFSLLAMPYLLLILSILEMSLMFTAESILEGSTTNAARQIKTGQLQQLNAGNAGDIFKEELCSMLVIVECDRVVIEVIPLASFEDAAAMQPNFDEEGNMIPAGFDAGGSSDRVLIRVAYIYRGLTPLVSQMLWGADSSRLMMSTLVLQTEPYDFAAELQANGEI